MQLLQSISGERGLRHYRYSPFQQKGILAGAVGHDHLYVEHTGLVVADLLGRDLLRSTWGSAGKLPVVVSAYTVGDVDAAPRAYRRIKIEQVLEAELKQPDIVKVGIIGFLTSAVGGLVLFIISNS